MQQFSPTSSRPPLDRALVSVVLPVFNEAGALNALYEGVRQALSGVVGRFEIIFVNDGSCDESGAILDVLAARDPRVGVVHLARNFGHQAAVQAGLAHAAGDAVIVMDADLQDDPAALGRFLAAWQEGYDVVYAQRVKRKEGLAKRSAFAAFHWLLSRITTLRVPADAGNFGLIDRRVLRQLLALGECDRYYPGLRHWVGLRQTGVAVERQARYDQRPRVSWWGLWRLAKTAIFSFSTLPLATFYVFAAVATLVCIAASGYALYYKLFTSLAVPGWTSFVVLASFFGALNSWGIAILGEYVVRIYDQVRRRPLYLVDRTRNVEPQAEAESPAETRKAA